MPHDDARARNQREVLELSEQLQRQFLAILNSGAWSLAPHIAAHALSELAGDVLRRLVREDAARLPWALDVVERVRQQVESAAVLSLDAGRPMH